MSVRFAALLLLAIFALVVAAFDWKLRRIPNWLTLAVAVCGLALALFQDGGWFAAGHALHMIIALAVGMVLFALKAIGGNRVYVLGRVNHAGEFPFANPLNVMQAISLAGGTTPYAALNEIVILRRQNGRQQAFSFRYSDVAHGHSLQQNIVLESGDTVVVP